MHFTFVKYLFMFLYLFYWFLDVYFCFWSFCLFVEAVFTGDRILSCV